MATTFPNIVHDVFRYLSPPQRLKVVNPLSEVHAGVKTWGCNTLHSGHILSLTDYLTDNLTKPLRRREFLYTNQRWLQFVFYVFLGWNCYSLPSPQTLTCTPCEAFYPGRSLSFNDLSELTNGSFHGLVYLRVLWVLFLTQCRCIHSISRRHTFSHLNWLNP